MKSNQIKVGSNTMTGNFVRKGKFEHKNIGEEVLYEGGGKDWSDASTGLEPLRISGNQQKLGKVKEEFSP